MQVGEEQITLNSSEQSGSVINWYKDRKQNLNLLDQWISQYWTEHYLNNEKLTIKEMDKHIHNLF